MKALMIDLESLSTEEDAVLVQIAWVVFDSKTFEVINRHVFHPNIQQQITLGRDVSASTLKWWMGQDDKAKQIFSVAGTATPDSVKYTLQQVLSDYNIQEVWSMGPLFDVLALSSFCGEVYTELFNFGAIRDVRTVREIARSDGVDLDAIYSRIAPGTHHDALSDCIWQIGLLKELEAARLS
jgi:hypothetical protein